jgi:putative DNA primase/helicase
MTPDIIQAFRAALLADLGHAPDTIQSDGQGHRFSTNGKRGNKDGRYRLHLDGIPAGYYECHRQGIKRNWKASKDQLPDWTPEQRHQHQQALERNKRLRYAEEQRHYEQAAERALRIWRGAIPAPEHHPYLVRKGIQPYLARLSGTALVIPLYDTRGRLWSVQYIQPNGEKRFLAKGKKHGLFCILNAKVNDLTQKNHAYLVEGYATGCTAVELAQDQPVIVAFDAGNLEPVVKGLYERFPQLSITLIADDDREQEQQKGVNIGKSKALAVAAHYSHVTVELPSFPPDAPLALTDLNDLYVWRKAQEHLLQEGAL